MKNLFPNSSITVTSDFRFQPLAYAAQQEDPILIQEMEMEGLKKLHYYPPLSRRYGKGVVASEVSLGGWTIGWRDVEFKVIFTSVSVKSVSEELADGAVVRGVLSNFHLVLDFGR
jgi:hypothetical protein